MTRDEILAKWDAMRPRERDAWVAEAVMGEQKQRRPIPCPDGIEGCAVAHYAYFKPYSTDIGAAFEVAEKMNGKSGFSLGRAGGYEPDRKWNVRVGTHEWEEADTAPEAISKAALLAVISG